MKHLKIQEGQNIAVIWEQAEDGEYTRRVAECQRLTNYDGNAHNEAAKQIVLACNCHDDLLEACQRNLIAMENREKAGLITQTWELTMLAHTKAAIAKATKTE
jgi:hypothetical protein